VREANDAKANFTTIVLRPRIWGEGDQTILPVVREMVAKGAFAWIDGGRAKTSTTNIANLVHAMNLALTNGQGGQAYFILDTENPVVFRDFMTKMMQAAAIPVPTRAVPGWLVRTIAYAGESTFRALGLKSKPPLTRFTANIMSRDCILSDAKARREMGYAPPVTMERGLESLARSLQVAGRNI
jgi:hypothetical protein